MPTGGTVALDLVRRFPAPDGLGADSQKRGGFRDPDKASHTQRDVEKIFKGGA
ncbi:MAG: hypothetical protein ACTSRS_15585 [Candidatus Helarchaeota archaeon]